MESIKIWFLLVRIKFADVTYATMYICIGFHEDNDRNTFGVWKKGTYRPLSDFNFYFSMKVLCKKSSSTGYLVSVMQERIDDSDNDRSARFIVICIVTCIKNNDNQ